MAEVKKRIRLTKKKPSKNHPNPQGRPESYNDKIAALIIKALITGKTLTRILKDPKLPSMPTVMNWLNRKHPNFKEDFFIAYYEARKIQAEILADETIDISDEKFEDAQRQALRVKTRHWLAAKINPKFSDKMQLTGKDDMPLIPETINVTVNFKKAKG